MKKFANFPYFQSRFWPKMWLVIRAQFWVFVLCFQSYFFSFRTTSPGLRVQFRYLLANLRKIHVLDVNMVHHKLTARNQYSCRLSNNHYILPNLWLHDRQIWALTSYKKWLMNNICIIKQIEKLVLCIYSTVIEYTGDTCKTLGYALLLSYPPNISHLHYHTINLYFRNYAFCH